MRKGHTLHGLVPFRPGPPPLISRPPKGPQELAPYRPCRWLPRRHWARPSAALDKERVLRSVAIIRRSIARMRKSGNRGLLADGRLDKEFRLRSEERRVGKESGS